MTNSRYRKKLFCVLLSLWLLVVSSGISAAQTMEIQDNEVMRLEQIFNQLATNNEQQQNELEQSKQDLLESKRLTADLLTATKEAKISMVAAQASLEKANLSLNQYEKETKREITKLKMERNLSILLAVFAFVKR